MVKVSNKIMELHQPFLKSHKKQLLNKVHPV